MLTVLQPSCADILKVWDPQTASTLRASTGIDFPFNAGNYCDRNFDERYLLRKIIGKGKGKVHPRTDHEGTYVE